MHKITFDILKNRRLVYNIIKKQINWLKGGFYMYVNVAYSVNENPNLENLSVPLQINNCGYYRVHTGPIIATEHPEGRNDYQLLYIAEGKRSFLF